MEEAPRAKKISKKLPRSKPVSHVPKPEANPPKRETPSKEFVQAHKTVVERPDDAESWIKLATYHLEKQQPAEAR